MDSRLYLHALNLLPNFGPKRLLKLVENFPDLKQAFFASVAQLVEAGIEPEVAQKFIDLRGIINLTRQEELLRHHRIKLLTIKEENYPALLSEINTPPPLLYYKGRDLIPDELCVAVVGTRKITNYGRAVTPLLVEPLVQAGAVIVSGLAYGVDMAAQEIAYSRNRRTIAVLGGGLDEDSLYPQHHVLAGEKLLDAGGTMLSEYPPGTPSLKYHFIARNRIISGLSVATVVVECDLKSGSLITAKYALEQNRAVYAVPGPIYSPQSQGPNNLIKMGAKPATAAADILDDLNLKTLPQQQETQSLFDSSPEEDKLLACLNFEPVSVDEIIKTCGLPPAQVTSALTFLEMKGKVKNLGAQQYILSRKS